MPAEKQSLYQLSYDEQLLTVYQKPFLTCPMESCVQSLVHKRDASGHKRSQKDMACCLAGRTPLAFSASVEGSVIEMKPTAPVPVDTMVSLKA